MESHNPDPRVARMWETSPDSEADSSSFELAGHKPESLSEKIVVLGSGYAGTGAVKQLEHELDGKAEITWISDVDHQLVLYESHRCIRNPDIQGKITFSCEELKSESTRFINAHVEKSRPKRAHHLSRRCCTRRSTRPRGASPTHRPSRLAGCQGRRCKSCTYRLRHSSLFHGWR
jgi:hypothetical protein